MRQTTTIIICDRCEKEITEGEQLHELSLNPSSFAAEALLPFKYDLCSPCGKLLRTPILALIENLDAYVHIPTAEVPSLDFVVPLKTNEEQRTH